MKKKGGVHMLGIIIYNKITSFAQKSKTPISANP